MRPPTLVELALLARVLTPFSAGDRKRIARQILAEVDAAARHLLKCGRAHPEFGDGSLMARCLALSPIAEPLANDPAFLASLIASCKALRNHSGT